MSELTPKTVVLSALYFIIAFILILLVDLGLGWFLNHFVFNILNWFNNLSFWVKIVVIFIGGGALFLAIIELTTTIPIIFGGLIFNQLPHNMFTLISSFILAIANAIWYIIWLWRIPNHFNFWIVCELLMLTAVIWSLSAIVLPAKSKNHN